MKIPILTTEWWRAAGLRAFKTALALVVPYLGASLLGDVPWATIASTALLAIILSFATSLLGIPDSAGVPLWVTLLEKSIKTFAQGIAAGIGNAILFQDVEWSTIVQTAAIATLATLVTVVAGTIPDANPAPVPVVIEPAAQVDQPVYADQSVVTAASASIKTLNGPRPPSGGDV